MRRAGVQRGIPVGLFCAGAVREAGFDLALRVEGWAIWEWRVWVRFAELGSFVAGAGIVVGF